MPMVWSVGGCSSLGSAQAVPWLLLERSHKAAIFRDCVLSATLVIRFSQKSLGKKLRQERWSSLARHPEWLWKAPGSGLAREPEGRALETAR